MGRRKCQNRLSANERAKGKQLAYLQKELNNCQKLFPMPCGAEPSSGQAHWPEAVNLDKPTGVAERGFVEWTADRTRAAAGRGRRKGQVGAGSLPLGLTMHRQLRSKGAARRSVRAQVRLGDKHRR